MKREYVRLLRNSNFKLNYASTRICILLVFLEVKSPQALLLPSASQFYVSSFISTSVFFFRSELCHPLLSPWLLLPQGFRPEGEIPRRYSSSLRGRRLKGKGKGRERERELCEREFQARKKARGARGRREGNLLPPPSRVVSRPNSLSLPFRTPATQASTPVTRAYIKESTYN